MSTAIVDAISQAALQYAALGWHVLPLKEGKKPRLNEWQKHSTVDEDTIAGWWTRWPDSNVGVQLGPRSGIVDIECDSPKAEKEILALFDGEVPPCPMFKSSRGTHRLFKYQDALGNNAFFHCGEIEVRTGGGDKGAQSVFPPSIHETGVQYQWLITPWEVEPPELPEVAYVKLCNLGGESPIQPKQGKGKEHFDKIIAGTGEGARNENMASLIGKMLHSMTNQVIKKPDELAVQYKLAQGINERNNPPLAEKELRSIFSSTPISAAPYRLTFSATGAGGQR